MSDREVVLDLVSKLPESMSLQEIAREIELAAARASRKTPQPLIRHTVSITHRHGRHDTATCGRPITTEQVKEWMADFP